jgi:hypothetical protein
VAEGGDFRDLLQARYEEKYNWIILMARSSSAIVPISELRPGKYEISVCAVNSKPAPILIRVNDADDPTTNGPSVAVFMFSTGDNSLSTETTTMELFRPVRRLRVNFINDLITGRGDRNATIRRLVIRKAVDGK